LIWGARISLRASFEIVGLAAIIAIPLGLVAGFFRGAVDSVIMRTMTHSSRSPRSSWR